MLEMVATAVVSMTVSVVVSWWYAGWRLEQMSEEVT